MTTRLEYLEAVRSCVLEWVSDSLDENERIRLVNAKLVWGAGTRKRRGLTVYDSWIPHPNAGPVDLIEVSALSEQSFLQLAGTLIHEMAHVLAGHEAGHKASWKDACARLGLVGAKARLKEYGQENFDTGLWAKIDAIEKPDDGEPGAGIENQKKKGSRLRKWQCGCSPKPVILRVARDDLRAECMDCGQVFKQEERGDGES